MDWIVALVVANLFGEPSWLRTEGTRIVDEAGDTVLLRGTNLGGWLLNELWLTGFRPWELEDDAGIRERLEARFGAATAESLLARYQDAYITDRDFDLLRDAGANCVRLPFFYRVLERDESPFTYLPEGWARLDLVVNACRARDMYVILDLHGAPGGQSASHTCGDSHRNELWANALYQERTVELWRAIASRYQNEPAVAGYDLLNEPWGNPENDPAAVPDLPDRAALLGLYDRIYDAIRSVDGRHMIFLENRLADHWELPIPAQQGWANIIYEFHPYDLVNREFGTHKLLVDTLTRSYGPFQRSRNVPLYMGEFFPWTVEGFDYYFREFNDNGWSWSPWAYKCWNRTVPDRYWGLYYRTAGAEPNIAMDSLSTLEARLASYVPRFYAANKEVIEIFGRHARAPAGGGARCAFYANGFSAPDGTPLEEGGRLAVFPRGGSGTILAGSAFVTPEASDWGCYVLKPQCRWEADARFAVAPGAGLVISVELNSFAMAKESLTDYEAELKLGLFREPVEEDPYAADTEGIVSLVQYESAPPRLRVRVHAKRSKGDNGTILNPTSQVVAFRAGARWSLEVNDLTCAVSYDGREIWRGNHGLRPVLWTGGGFAALAILHYGTQRIQEAAFDNLRIERRGALFASGFQSDCVGLVGMPLAAQPDEWAVPPASPIEFMEEGLRCSPPDGSGQSVWLNAMADYQNGARFSLGEGAGQMLRCDIALGSFVARRLGPGADGAVRIVLLPEYWGNPVLSYGGPAVYLELLYDATGPALGFSAFYHEGAAGSRRLIAEGTRAFAPHIPVSLALSREEVVVLYDGARVCRGTHGVDIDRAFPDGIWLHLEAENGENDNSVDTILESVRVGLSAGAFGFWRGDCNGDGQYNISDAVCLLVFLFAKGELACGDAGDANDDGELNIADAIRLLSFLFARGTPPSEPFQRCGPDPTSDETTCETYPRCE